MAISAATREAVKQRANFYCEYCRSAEWLMGNSHEIDHILPRSLGGSDAPDNLCLACTACNRRKQASTLATDPLTAREVPLFNPRHQIWSDHFAWIDDDSRLAGLTECGRATIDRLKLNRELLVRARKVWRATGNHPPS